MAEEGPDRPFPQTKAELINRLLQEGTKKELITVHEYKRLLCEASFKCPKPRQIMARCDGKACPTRPDPCDECVFHRQWLKVFNSRSDQERRDKSWDAFMAHCSECDKPTAWLEETDYYDECSRGRRARNRLSLVNEGKIIVQREGWGVTR